MFPILHYQDPHQNLFLDIHFERACNINPTLNSDQRAATIKRLIQQASAYHISMAKHSGSDTHVPLIGSTIHTYSPHYSKDLILSIVPKSCFSKHSF